MAVVLRCMISTQNTPIHIILLFSKGIKLTESLMNFLSFKHRFISDVTFNAKQRIKLQDDASAREAFNVFTDEEVRKSIINAIDNIGQNIQVIFRTKKCQDCSQIGDERLMSKYCHMQSTWIHTGISEDCHPGFTEPYHRYLLKKY